MENPSVLDILLLPALVGFFGFAICIAAWVRAPNEDKMPRFRFVGLALLVVSLFLGFQQTWALVNRDTGPFYQASLVGAGRSVIYAHYVAFAAPLIGILIFVGVDLNMRKYRSDREI